ncbi:uncharacterized protein [Nicotiana sylvestris]|uniref:uncharacterized protein n=1 Tax=Nicotiana sylvestris TaxID=4096 RepID=UPI00388C6455
MGGSVPSLFSLTQDVSLLSKKQSSRNTLVGPKWRRRSSPLFSSHLMREVWEQFKITHQNSTPYQPKANGAVKVANKNIKKILRKMIQSSRQWHEKLPFALLGYRTTVRTSVGAMPYLLVYGTEAVIPAEVEIPSLQIIVEAEIEDSE